MQILIPPWEALETVQHYVP